PLCVKTPTGTAGCQLVAGARASVPVAATTCPPWTFVNTGAYGYFRTAYSREMLSAIAPDLATSFIDPERLMVVGDEWALVRAGRHARGDSLPLAAGFGKEHTNGVLEEVSPRLIFTHDYLTNASTRPRYARFVQSLFDPLYRELGINAAPGENDDT